MKIEDLTPENVGGLSLADLLYLRDRVTQIYNSRFKGNLTKAARFSSKGRLYAVVERSDLLLKNQILVREIKSRGQELKSVSPIDREMWKQSMKTLDVGSLPRIIVIENFAAIQGEYLEAPKTSDLLSVVFKCQATEMSEAAVTEVIEKIHAATQKDIACEFNISGPEADHVPAYDLVLVPRHVTQKASAPANNSRIIKYENTGQAPIYSKWNIEAERDAMDMEKREKAAAWIDEKLPVSFLKFRMIHHRSEDGKVVLRGLQKAMGDLMDIRRGARIPEDERRQVYEHLAKHYREFEKEPPPFRALKADRRTILKPYPNEHACRLLDPAGFEGFSRITRSTADGKEYSVIYGIRTVEGKRVSAEQAYRYPKSGWTEKEARAHCREHKGISFEAAIEKEDIRFKILKIDAEKQIVGGIVYEPNKVDTQEEYTDAKEIERAQIAFMEKYGTDTNRIKIQHQGQSFYFPIIESFIPEQPTKKGKDIIPAGAWWLMIKITSKVIWEEIKAGRLTGFSMGGTAKHA